MIEDMEKQTDTMLDGINRSCQDFFDFGGQDDYNQKEVKEDETKKS